MSRSLLILILIICFSFSGFSQTPTDTSRTTPDTTRMTDTLRINDTLAPLPAIDSFSRKPFVDSAKAWTLLDQDSTLPLTWKIMSNHPWLKFSNSIETRFSDHRNSEGKETLFYAIVALLLVYAVLRSAFPKYFSDLFRLFFRTTLKQRQIREQLMQTPLPSLMLNGFFIVTAGLYVAFILKHYGIDPYGNFWLTGLYASMGLSAIYMIKFLGLKISGWLFNMPEAANSYVFIVFVVNKMIGILLLPFIVILAFAVGDLYQVGLYLSFALLAGLYLYRFILTFAAVRNQVRVNPFHFLLYLLAFELAPLLLIYKGLLVFLRQTA